MTALFKTPKVPVQKAPAVTPTPTIDDAARAQNEANRLRARRGAQSNFLAGPLGFAVPSNNLATKQLTGQ